MIKLFVFDLGNVILPCNHWGSRRPLHRRSRMEPPLHIKEGA